MKKFYVIADSDVLSSFAQAEKTPGCESRLSHLPEAYEVAVLVPREVREEMLKSLKNTAARQFGETLRDGFEEMNPRVVDPALHRQFKLREDLEKGEAHCIALAEELARDGSAVLILSNERKVSRVVNERAQELGLDISAERTVEILCNNAEHGLIKDLKHESALWHDSKICQFSAAQRQTMDQLHDHLQSQQHSQDNSNEH